MPGSTKTELNNERKKACEDETDSQKKFEALLSLSCYYFYLLISK
jgi:hypothetical protein